MVSHSGGPLPFLHPHQYGERGRRVLQPLKGAARNPLEVPSGIVCKETPWGLGSPTRGLNPNTNDVSSPSSPLLVPQVSSVEVEGSAFHDLPRLVWNNDSGVAQIGSFPVGGRLFLCPASVATNHLGSMGPRGHFMGLLARLRGRGTAPVPYSIRDSIAMGSEKETGPLGRHRFLYKEAVEVIHRLESSPGYFSHYFLALKKTGDLWPILNHQGLNKFLRVGALFAWKLSPLLFRIYTPVGGWSLDLKDAYLHMPIHRSHWRYLPFALGFRRSSPGLPMESSSIRLSHST